MQATMAAAVSSARETSPLSLPTTTIRETIQKGVNETDFAKRREIFEEAYSTLRKADLRDPETHKLASELFLAYGEKTLHNQTIDGDSEAGFRKCAYLTELAFCLQLKQLDLLDVDYNWAEQETLSQLVNSLEIVENEQKRGKFTSHFTNLTADAQVVASRADDHKMRQLVSKTVVRITYSHQNIASLRLPTEQNAAFHQKWTRFAETVIGSDTLEQKKALVDYMYNRCSFLVGLKSLSDHDAKFQSYEPVKAKIQQIYAPGEFDRDSLLAQCDNMQGITIARSNKDDKFVQAEPYFQKSYAARKALVARAEPGNRQNDQKQLLNNVRSCLIRCQLEKIAKLDPASNEMKKEAGALLTLQQETEQFLKEAAERNDQNTYNKN